MFFLGLDVLLTLDLRFPLVFLHELVSHLCQVYFLLLSYCYQTSSLEQILANRLLAVIRTFFTASLMDLRCFTQVFDELFCP